MAYILTEVAEFVGTITLDHARRRNALSQPLVEEVITALHAFRDARVRVVILRAKPGVKVFSAGHDIDELPESRRDPLGWDDPLRQLVREIENFPGPVIAMIEGGVWGGATETVFACDMIVAADTATFAVTPAKLGVPYNVGGMLTFLNATGLHMDVGILLCVDRCWPKTRQTRLSDRPSFAFTCSTQARRAGLRSFPWRPLSGSSCRG